MGYDLVLLPLTRYDILGSMPKKSTVYLGKAFEEKRFKGLVDVQETSF